jgi:UDP-N-acetylmuramate--alanine ligase
MDDVDAAFLQFMDALPFYGATTACLDNERLRALLPRVRRRVYTYGESPEADFRLQMLPPDPNSKPACHSTFEVNSRGLLLGPFRLHVPGRHNVLNATAAIAIGVQLGIAPDEIAAGLETFRGVDRRFQLKGSIAGVAVVDDYGHHPTEILATLRAARDCGYNHVHVLFQPHRYTRTCDLLPEFAAAFGDADSVQILDIYAASEEPIPGITAEILAQKIPHAEYAASIQHAVETLAARAQPGDVLLTLGAGNVSQIAPLLLDALHTPVAF